MLVIIALILKMAIPQYLSKTAKLHYFTPTTGTF